MSHRKLSNAQSFIVRYCLPWSLVTKNPVIALLTIDLFHATRNVRLRLWSPPSDRCKKYQKINIINIISMVFYGFFYGSIINNFYGSIISRLFYCFLFFFYGSIKFNQVEFPSFFRDPMDFLAGSSLEMPFEPPQDLDPKRSPGLPALQKASKKNHPAGRRQKKTGRVYQVWQKGILSSTYSSTSNFLWILTWCQWFLINIQYMEIF